MAEGASAGWRTLLRLALRRDRVLVPGWGGVLALTAISSVSATVDLYPTGAGRASAVDAINANPALVAIYGQVADRSGIGGLATFKTLLLGGVFLAMLCVVLVRRHTRGEEESGRAELLAATPIGHQALLVAAVAEGVLVAAVTGLVTGVGLAVAGLDLAGSLAFGLVWVGLGVVAVGVSATAVQLSASTRTVGGAVAGVLGTAYVLRAVADVSSDAGRLGWLSPFGWATRVRVYDENRWWVLLLFPLLGALGVAVGTVLARHRDLGAGLVAARPGPPHARIATLRGLQARLQRSGLVTWLVAVLVLGGVLGAIAPGVADLVGSGPAAAILRRVGGGAGLVASFLATEFAFVGLGVTALAIVTVTRAAGDESEGHAELLLSTGQSRAGAYAATAAVTLLAPVLVALGGGLGAALAYGPQTDGPDAALRELLPAALAPLPAVWVVAGLALLLLGLRRSWAVLGWVVLAACLLLGQVGELFGLPGWMTGLSPYSRVPRMPAEQFALGPEVLLTAVAGAFVACGLAAYRRRDVG